MSPSPPKHVAVIMDGNGRWAARRGLPRPMGHRAGVEAVRRTVRLAPEFGVERLTLFSFSTENWSRPRAEVSALMDLLRGYVDQDLEKLAEDGVRVRVVGERAGLSPDITEIIARAEAHTAENDRFGLDIAFNYGARAEIVAATRALAAEAAAGRLDPGAIDEAMISERLFTAGASDPDLVIRTSGEMRISNFLLWQAAYAEFVFLDVLWPDFGREHFAEALAAFGRRERRFGAVAPADAG